MKIVKNLWSDVEYLGWSGVYNKRKTIICNLIQVSVYRYRNSFLSRALRLYIRSPVWQTTGCFSMFINALAHYNTLITGIDGIIFLYTNEHIYLLSSLITLSAFTVWQKHINKYWMPIVVNNTNKSIVFLVLSNKWFLSFPHCLFAFLILSFKFVYIYLSTPPTRGYKRFM